MEFNIKGSRVGIEARHQTNEDLVSAAQEIATTVIARGLPLPEIENPSNPPTVLVEKNEELEKIGNQIREQLPFAYEACRQTITGVNSWSPYEDRSESYPEEAAVEDELEAWLTSDRLTQARALQEANPDLQFTLAAVPNILVNSRLLVPLHDQFCYHQPGPADIYKKIFRLYDNYDPKLISGTNPHNGLSVKFLLIPDKGDERLKDKGIGQLWSTFKSIQEFNPNFTVPTPFEAEVYRRTLRVKDGALEGEGTQEKTYIAHFSMEPRNMGGFTPRLFPTSYVNDNGGLSVGGEVGDYLPQASRLAIS